MIKSNNKIRVLADEIKTCKASVDEQETTITISRSSDVVSIWTNDNTMLTKFKRCLQAGDEWECYEGPLTKDGDPSGYFIYTSKKAIAFRSKRRAKRNLTDEQRQKMSERLKKARKSK